MNDWKECIEKFKGLEVNSINVLKRKQSNTYLKNNIKKYDLIIILHSVLGDNVEIINSYKSFFLNRRGKVLSFIGNEYSLIKEKKEFLQKIECDYIASQLPQKAYEFLYSDLNAQLISAPCVESSL